MDESPNVNMLSQSSIRQEAENAVGDAIGVPKSSDRFGTLQFNYETFNAPWIKNATSNAFDETSNLVQEYQNLIKTDSNGNEEWQKIKLLPRNFNSGGGKTMILKDNATQDSVQQARSQKKDVPPQG